MDRDLAIVVSGYGVGNKFDVVGKGISLDWMLYQVVSMLTRFGIYGYVTTVGNRVRINNGTSKSDIVLL